MGAQSRGRTRVRQGDPADDGHQENKYSSRVSREPVFGK